MVNCTQCVSPASQRCCCRGILYIFREGCENIFSHRPSHFNGKNFLHTIRLWGYEEIVFNVVAPHIHIYRVSIQYTYDVWNRTFHFSSDIVCESHLTKSAISLLCKDRSNNYCECDRKWKFCCCGCVIHKHNKRYWASERMNFQWIFSFCFVFVEGCIVQVSHRTIIHASIYQKQYIVNNFVFVNHVAVHNRKQNKLPHLVLTLCTVKLLNSIQNSTTRLIKFPNDYYDGGGNFVILQTKSVSVRAQLPFGKILVIISLQFHLKISVFNEIRNTPIFT